MTPIFSGIIDPFPDHVHDHLVFIAAKQVNIWHDNASFPGKKYGVEFRSKSYWFLDACAISARSDP